MFKLARLAFLAVTWPLRFVLRVIGQALEFGLSRGVLRNRTI